MKDTTTKWVLGHRVTPHNTIGDYDLLTGETPGKTDGPPPHSHQTYKEVFLITEGEMVFIADGKSITLKAGESIDIAPNTVHTFTNKSDKACKWVNIHSPKGFRQFFESLGVPEKIDNAAQLSLAPEIIQKVIETASNYDMYLKM
ncbi:cupin domain-containing protein [Mesonia sp. K7]|uniref:cupin domain-containing protein n=1 Tax=Mesonia sp. K7 TaxID=2218606 RepID=UPI000DA86096|nr:cupin domain-containing protein [Mesonia sp. K7]PZD77876.1 cupin domain-containing protein [Mesonia sp. K7]